MRGPGPCQELTHTTKHHPHLVDDKKEIPKIQEEIKKSERNPRRISVILAKLMLRWSRQEMFERGMQILDRPPPDWTGKVFDRWKITAQARSIWPEGQVFLDCLVGPWLSIFKIAPFFCKHILKICALGPHFFALWSLTFWNSEIMRACTGPG